MSRHTLPRTTANSYLIIVGYDPPLETFFAQVYDTTLEEPEEAELLWVGLDVGELPTVEVLQTALWGWATLPGEVVERLRGEQQEARPPSALQRAMRQVCSDVREDMRI